MDRWQMMYRRGFSPKAVTICATFGLAALMVSAGLNAGGRLSLRDQPSAALGNAFCVVAYVIALLSCRGAAALYPRNSPIRLGWLAMCANCLLSIVRHLALNPVFQPLIGPKERVYLISQTVMLPALIFALLGMLAMWWGVYRLGLGFRIRLVDGAAIGAAAIFVTCTFHNNLSHSGDGIMAVLQAISLSLLIAIGGVGLLLNGLSMQMGGGRLAVVMRCLAAYGLTRSFLTLSESHRNGFAMVWWLCFYAIPWIFAFGATYSSWLADTVKRSLRTQMDSDWGVSDTAS